MAVIETGIRRGLYFAVYYRLKSSKDENFLMKLRNGWISGLISYIPTHFFDVIRYRMQAARNSSHECKSAFSTMIAIIKEGGILSLNKGLLNVYGFGIRWALIISFYDTLISFM